jgi:hypothetical protein
MESGEPPKQIDVSPVPVNRLLREWLCVIIKYIYMSEELEPTWC